QPSREPDEEDQPEDADPRDRVGAGMEDLRHRRLVPSPLGLSSQSVDPVNRTGRSSRAPLREPTSVAGVTGGIARGPMSGRNVSRTVVGCTIHLAGRVRVRAAARLRWRRPPVRLGWYAPPTMPESTLAAAAGVRFRDLLGLTKSGITAM